MQCTGLVRFLGEVSLADVLTVAGPPVLDAYDPECVRYPGHDAFRNQPANQRLALLHRRDDVKSGSAGVAAPDHEATAPRKIVIVLRGCWSAEFAENRRGLRPFHCEGSQV